METISFYKSVTYDDIGTLANSLTALHRRFLKVYIKIIMAHHEAMQSQHRVMKTKTLSF